MDSKEEPKITLEQLADAFTNPKEAKETMAVSKSTKWFNTLVSTRRWPAECTLAGLLVSFGNRAAGKIGDMYATEHTKKLIKMDKHICLTHVRNFIFKFNCNVKYVEQVTAAALQAITMSDWPAAVVLAGFQAILEKIMAKNGGRLVGIKFTFVEFDEAVDRVFRHYKQDALAAYQMNSDKIDAALGMIYKHTLLEKGRLDHADATLTWAQIINKKKGGGPVRPRRQPGGGGNTPRYPRRGSGGPGSGLGKVRGSVRSSLENKYGAVAAQKMLKEGVAGGYCLGFNYLSCPFGGTCRFKHVCCKCGDRHPAKECKDNYDVIKETMDGIHPK